MKRSITSSLADVSFHDSTIESFVRIHDSIILTFDWAKVADKDDGLIIYSCRLILMGISHISLSPEKYKMDCLGSEYSLVGLNSSASDNDLVLGGFYESNEEHSWVDLKCRFESFTLEWEIDQTVEEWKSGNTMAEKINTTEPNHCVERTGGSLHARLNS
jgi:hypothetical protein